MNNGTFGARKLEAIRSVYRNRFLKVILPQKVKSLDATGLADFQTKTANQAIPGFTPNRVIVSGELITENGRNVKGIFKTDDAIGNALAAHNEEHWRANSYRTVKRANKGRFLNFAELLDGSKDFPPNPIDDLFAQWNTSDTLSCCFCSVPLFNNRSFYMSYMLSNGYTLPDDMSRHEIEYFSIPFLIAWFLHMDIIDAETYEKWTDALIDLTPMQVAICRDIVNSSRYSGEEIAAKYNITDKTYETHISNIHNAKAHLIDADPMNDAGKNKPRNQSRIMNISKIFMFLVFVGDVKLGPINIPTQIGR